jgi:hypothetical protein
MPTDKEVVVMVDALCCIRPKRRCPLRLLSVFLLAASLAGCASAALDVRDYYRQMETNYKEAKEKAKMDALTLEGESKVLASTGEFSKYRRTRRELDRIQSWEARCAKQEERFQKAAEWTEKHYHIEKPKSTRSETAPAELENGIIPSVSGAGDP